MAFASATKQTTVIGNVRLVIGTYANGAADSGGAIATGLNEIFFFSSNNETSQSATTNRVVISGGTATITTVVEEDGKWIAIGV